MTATASSAEAPGRSGADGARGSSTTAIHSVQLVSDGEQTPDAWVHFAEGRVRARGVGDSWRALPAEHVVDGSGCLLTPGFIELHLHGGGGYANEDGAEAMRGALAAHRAHGTTRAVLSLVTNTQAALLDGLATIAGLSRSEPGLLGSHLEGPFLAERFKGAHEPGLLRSPTADELEALLAAADGTLRQLTLAPELPGAGEAISTLVEHGVIAAVGHTSADYERTLAAFDAGASLLTHAFNGMPGLHHRAPGPVGAAFRSSHVALELINDGVHVHPAVAEVLFARAPRRVALITDAMAAACFGDGRYRLGSREVVVQGGRAQLADGDSIAGSTLTLDAALRQTVRSCGVPLAEAVRALTETPAAVLGLGHELGSLRVGHLADAVLLDAELGVRRVWLAGEAAAAAGG